MLSTKLEELFGQQQETTVRKRGPRPVPLGRFDAELKPLVARSSTFLAAPPVAFAPLNHLDFTAFSFM